MNICMAKFHLVTDKLFMILTYSCDVNIVDFVLPK